MPMPFTVAGARLTVFVTPATPFNHDVRLVLFRNTPAAWFHVPTVYPLVVAVPLAVPVLTASADTFKALVKTTRQQSLPDVVAAVLPTFIRPLAAVELTLLNQHAIVRGSVV